MLPQIVDESFENKVLDTSQEEYHARTDCVHYSSLKHILKSPHAYLFNLKNPIKQSPSMRIGSIAHTCILEGAEFLNKFVVAPVFEGETLDGKMSTRSKAAKEKLEEWRISLPQGSQIITRKESDDLRYMIDSIINNKAALAVLQDSDPEFKGIWRDSNTGLQSIMSVDFVSIRNQIQGEFKTTTDCRWNNFKRQVEDDDLLYYLQVSIYNEGIKAIYGKELQHKVWVVTENKRPFETRVYEVHQGYLNAGYYLYRKAMKELYTSIVNNSWPQGQVIVEDGLPNKWFLDYYENIDNR